MGGIVTTPLAIIISVLSTRPSDIVFWIKWIISYIFIRIFRRVTKRRFDLYDMSIDHDPVKTNFISPHEEIAIESPLDEFQLYTTSDEIFFYGVNSKSECLVTRITRGVNHSAEAWIYLKLSDGKTYQLQETSGFQQSNSEEKVFTCGGLQMHYMVPMRRWRIFFNGLLREKDGEDTGSEKQVYVKFAFIWKATSEAFDFTYDVNACALARGLAKAKWEHFVPPLEKVNRAINFYAQSGVITGTVSLEGREDEQEIYLFGEKVRFIGDQTIINEAKFNHVLGQLFENGSFVHLSAVSIKNVVDELTFGFVVPPTGKTSITTDSHFILESTENKVEAKNDIMAKFHTEGRNFFLKANVQDYFQKKESREIHSTVAYINLEMNSIKGAGIMIKGKQLETLHAISPSSPKLKNSSVSPFVVSFSEEICQDSSLTGGKGSSLGKLTELSQEFKNFLVPNGIVVTTKAYELFIINDTKREIEYLENILYGNTEGDVKAACERVMAEVIKSNIPDQVLQAIVNTLQKNFPDKDIVKFAVRSSATGEDTEQMSAAGQMDTFLGVSGLREILSAVKKCWASQFSFIAVQYKKQYGQIINSPMAVVIQKMVPCDAAGVLFTCDPLTGNPTFMSITANYGLGESVVSASEEPDTLEIRRGDNNDLSVSKKIIGAKHRRIIQDDEGTHSENVTEEERQTCCISDGMALQLAAVAIQIEKRYRSHRDIEWGFWKSKLYIFQSRPVTSGSSETDFEIEHEFDAPMRIENEYFTVANVGEVMPGALTPLTIDAVFKHIRLSFQRENLTLWHSDFRPKYFTKGIMTVYNHAMFFISDLFENIYDDKETSRSAAINIFGRELDDPGILDSVAERFKVPEKKFRKLTKRIFGAVGFLKLIRRIFTCRQHLEEAKAYYDAFRIPIEKYHSAQELFEALLYSCTDLCKGVDAHMLNTEASSIWNMFIINILRKSAGELNSDIYHTLSQLLTTTCEVESADVPAAMERLAFHIANEKDPEEFKKMDTKDIVEWLSKSETSAGVKYREFLEKHGHRCLKEFDLRINPWGTDPTSLVQLLKNLVGNTTTELDKKKKDFKVNLPNLKLGLKDKLFLKFLLPQSHIAVQNREQSKSVFIKSTDAWRKGYQQLSKLMASEGRIPDSDLLFFMTLDEIKELLSTRSPKIISKANHRRRLFPVMDKYIFPEIMRGFPKPANMDRNITVISDDKNFSMKGIPVSQGIAKAYVRVALTLEEAANLKPGEILVTFSTDIGWSPYFPMLAGVVTEIGGLISHGAVVSREYGLPCIAGVYGATIQFQTGDYVLLDGNKGVLQKLPKPDSLEVSS